MHFKQFYVGCLAHASYLIGDSGECAVVDPARDVDMYLDEAKAQGLAIRWVLETHLHADFVSGHRELAERTGATIGIGARAGARFPHRALDEGDEIALGAVRLRALETPGHTPESLTFLVFERAGDREPWGALTGDTLFVGDVGRVDILSSRLPVAELAGLMFDSLHGKLLALPDATRVYPAHGAGSLCGRSLSSESWSTIGRERAMNPALRTTDRAAFIADVTRDVPETPAYFLHSRDLNQAGPPLATDGDRLPWVSPESFAAAATRGARVIDTRPAAAFGAGHVPGAIHVSLDGQFASWVGTLVEPGAPLLLVADAERAEEAVTRLGRIGYERIDGVLEGGIERWRAEGRPVRTLAQRPVTDVDATESRVLDVRRGAEWERFHMGGAVHVSLADLPSRLASLDRDAEWTVVCASGYRSSIAASLLAAAGFPRVTNAVGGMDAWRAAGRPVVAASA